MWHHNYGQGPGPGMMGYNWLLVIGFIILAIIILVGIFILFRTSQQNPSNKTKENNALTILKERYAKGELSEEEFKHKRKVLEEE